MKLASLFLMGPVNVEWGLKLQEIGFQNVTGCDVDIQYHVSLSRDLVTVTVLSLTSVI